MVQRKVLHSSYLRPESSNCPSTAPSDGQGRQCIYDQDDNQQSTTRHAVFNPLSCGLSKVVVRSRGSSEQLLHLRHHILDTSQLSLTIIPNVFSNSVTVSALRFLLQDLTK